MITERKFGIHIVTPRVVSFPDGGEYYQVDFENGYGCSIIRHPYSYGGSKGLWEIGVLHNGELCYNNSSIDVIGYLKEQQVADYLDQIAQFPVNLSCEHKR